VAGLSLAGVTKRFAGTPGEPPAPPPAVDAVSLTVDDGEFVALLGPSGSGKTTLLRLIAGFETPDRGEIRLGETTVSGPGRFVPPERRRVGVVFQTHALWPHMTVRRNVGYPLEVRGLGGADYDRRVAGALATVGLTGLDARHPAELSGGQRQRVALARCLVMEPSVVLLDEPLASLDAHLRAALQEEFVTFHRATGATMLYITHDQSEAMALADRIAVLDRGRLVQVATPAALYREPAASMVARFVGRGLVVRGRVLEPASDGDCPVELFGYRTRLRARRGHPAGPADLCLRSEALRVAAPDEPGIPVTVRRAVYQGGRMDVETVVDGTEDCRLTLPLPVESPPAPGTALRLAIADGWVVPA
jgi:iron(III) transport system ATP-binding protein